MHQDLLVIQKIRRLILHNFPDQFQLLCHPVQFCISHFTQVPVTCHAKDHFVLVVVRLQTFDQSCALAKAKHGSYNAVAFWWRRCCTSYMNWRNGRTAFFLSNSKGFFLLISSASGSLSGYVFRIQNDHLFLKYECKPPLLSRDFPQSDDFASLTKNSSMKSFKNSSTNLSWLQN